MQRIRVQTRALSRCRAIPARPCGGAVAVWDRRGLGDRAPELRTLEVEGIGAAFPFSRFAGEGREDGVAVAVSARRNA